MNRDDHLTILLVEDYDDARELYSTCPALVGLSARRAARTEPRAPTRPASSRSRFSMLIDNVIDKGLAVDAEIVLGLADIDLIYLMVGALLAAADRVFGQPPKQRRKVAATVHELADRHGIDASDLNLDLGPLGTLR